MQRESTDSCEATPIATTFGYNDADELLSESYAGGTLAGLSVTNGYDCLLRRTNVSLLSPVSCLPSPVFRVRLRLRLPPPNRQ